VTETTFVRSKNDINPIERLDPNYYAPVNIELISFLISKGAVPLKSIAKTTRKKGLILRDPQAIIRYIELSDIDPTFPAIINSTKMPVYEAPSRASYEIKEGDIITAVSGNSTGTKHHVTAYVTSEYDGCICSNGFRVIRATQVNTFYLLSYMKTEYFLKQIYRYRTGAAIPAINDKDLENTLVVLPTVEQQERIAKEVQDSLKMRHVAITVFKNIVGDLDI
jgi:type I restriction enzyme M protein